MSMHRAKGLKIHFTDKGTWPLIACIGGGAALCTYYSLKCLFLHPDVRWRPAHREDQLFEDEEAAKKMWNSSWRNWSRGPTASTNLLPSITGRYHTPTEHKEPPKLQ
eukprot:TRINITY_DN526_c0_g1_i4.p1 TRINITY_DN526_c0_g1~~TRINITY_DN526_c0_g1_i4.p1  ORF type:complete len:107 (+),score=0.41 TRINITY_DN526_c0_g1_i4:108-428(+)